MHRHRLMCLFTSTTCVCTLLLSHCCQRPHVLVWRLMLLLTPLCAGFKRMVTGGFQTFKYFVKVVPTEFYSVTGGHRALLQQPGWLAAASLL